MVTGARVRASLVSTILGRTVTTASTTRTERTETARGNDEQHTSKGGEWRGSKESRKKALRERKEKRRRQRDGGQDQISGGRATASAKRRGKYDDGDDVPELEGKSALLEHINTYKSAHGDDGVSALLDDGWIPVDASALNVGRTILGGDDGHEFDFAVGDDAEGMFCVEQLDGDCVVVGPEDFTFVNGDITLKRKAGKKANKASAASSGRDELETTKATQERKARSKKQQRRGDDASESVTQRKAAGPAETGTQGEKSRRGERDEDDGGRVGAAPAPRQPSGKDDAMVDVDKLKKQIVPMEAVLRRHDARGLYAKVVAMRDRFALAPQMIQDVVAGWGHWELHPMMTDALAHVQFVEPTKVQQQVISAALIKQSDIIAAAQTGSGKTLAFAIPIVQGILAKYAQRLAAGALDPGATLIASLKAQGKDGHDESATSVVAPWEEALAYEPSDACTNGRY